MKVVLLLVWALVPVRRDALRRGSRALLPISYRERVRRWLARCGSLIGRLGPLGYVLLLGLPFIPVSFTPGVLGCPEDTRAYLETLWQVVAAALGLSIALVGFVFQAFASAMSRSVAGSLREFVRSTRLQVALAIGFASLIVDGIVLLGLGEDAPGGWAGATAIGLSGIALGIALPFVFFQSLRAFEFEFLIALRKKVIEGVVDRAMGHQLRGQAGYVQLQTEKEAGVAQGLTVGQDQVGISFKQTRVLRDVKIAPLRGLARHARPSVDRPGAVVELLVALDERVSADRAIVAIPSGQSRLWRLAVRACLRTRRYALGEDPNAVLTDELSRLHQAAKSAIADGRSGDWGQISDVYVSALLAMPRATHRMSVPFAGAVASPGPFSLGPLDRVTRFLYAEMEAALRQDDRSLALDVAYLPMRVAHDAADLDAPGLVAAMLSLYPMLYRLTSA